MRSNQLLTLLLFLLPCAYAHAQLDSLVISGTYQGKALYVQNPYITAQNQFCISRVEVNGTAILDHPRASAVRVDPGYLGIAIGEVVEIVLLHWPDCTLRIVNPEVIIFQQKFELFSLSIGTAYLRWQARGELVGGYFTVQRLVYGDWQNLKRVEATAGRDIHHYQHKPEHAPGLNEYRVCYQDKLLSEQCSEVQRYEYSAPPVTFSPTRVTDKMQLSRAVFFEILDEYGNQILKGESKTIPLRRLPTGTYYIVLEGEKHQFYKE